MVLCWSDSAGRGAGEAKGKEGRSQLLRVGSIGILRNRHRHPSSPLPTTGHCTMQHDALKDRTAEFKSCVEGAQLRLSAVNESKRPLLTATNPNALGTKGNRSEFARMAGKIGKDIQGTTLKLEKLAQRESEREGRTWRYSAGVWGADAILGLQSRGGRHCLMIGQSRSVSVPSLSGQFKMGMELT